MKILILSLCFALSGCKNIDSKTTDSIKTNDTIINQDERSPLIINVDEQNQNIKRFLEIDDSIKCIFYYDTSRYTEDNSLMRDYEILFIDYNPNSKFEIKYKDYFDRKCFEIFDTNDNYYNYSKLINTNDSVKQKIDANFSFLKGIWVELLNYQDSYYRYSDSYLFLMLNDSLLIIDEFEEPIFYAIKDIQRKSEKEIIIKIAELDNITKIQDVYFYKIDEHRYIFTFPDWRYVNDDKEYVINLLLINLKYRLEYPLIKNYYSELLGVNIFDNIDFEKLKNNSF